MTAAAPPQCPACEADRSEPVYELLHVPAHSVLLMDSAEEARSFPRGDLALRCCLACGFVWNERYDASLQAYSARCEESQGCSPTFGAWVRGLAQRTAALWQERRGPILEIGCGKGEFLALLCELTGRTGVGIDPAFVPGRLPPQQEARLTVLRELYSEAHLDIEARAICCRHTLEHIGPVRDFMLRVARHADRHGGAAVFFELPDALRVLREGAFWDVYYEHCSYFTAGSLARLLRSTGFALDVLELDYDDQYILAFGGRGGWAGGGQERFDVEEPLEELLDAARTFAQRAAQVAQRWRKRIEERAHSGEAVVLWGGGSKGVAFLTTLGLEEEVRAVVDINPHKQGRFMPGTGHPVVAPEELRAIEPGLVVVMNPVYVEEISRSLRELGVEAEVAAL